MCGKAKEIQDTEDVGGTWIGNRILYHIAPMNQPHDRDGYYYVIDEEAIRRCESCGNEESYIKSSKCIWLPRQDQLQEMLGQYYAEQDDGKVFTPHYIKVAFLDFVTWMGIQYHPEPFVCVPTNCFDSGEQLWIAFVMKEKYNKIWNGGEWIGGH